jgi:hypothetical protein
MESPGARRVLSSSSTWSYQYFWPAFCAVFFAVITVILWRIHATGNDKMIWFGRAALPVAGIGATSFGIWYGNRIKRVELDDAGLRISGYGRNILVLFSEIDSCHVNWEGQRATLPVVTIELRRSTALGSRISFIAVPPWNNDHSIVAELRERRDQALAK